MRSIAAHQPSRICCLDVSSDLGGIRGHQLWLATSVDRRISIWTADWLQNNIEVLDWLSLPAPAFEQSAELPVMPPTLARFAPHHPDTVVVTCFAATPELLFYGLRDRHIYRRMAIVDWANSLSISPDNCLIAVGTMVGWVGPFLGKLAAGLLVRPRVQQAGDIVVSAKRSLCNVYVCVTRVGCSCLSTCHSLLLLAALLRTGLSKC